MATLIRSTMAGFSQRGMFFQRVWMLALITYLGCFGVGAATAAPRISAIEMAQARDYVLAACIIDRYPSTPLATEADAWAGGLVEAGSLPAKAYPALAKLAKSAPPFRKTQNGTIMRLQGCVDFVNGSDFV
jgi:hypothetical protein